MQHRIIGNLAIVMLSALANALLLAGCGWAIRHACGRRRHGRPQPVATIAAAFNTPPRNDDDVATAAPPH